jgi:tetratricopeptide (TPR) repeat protein
MTNSAGSRLQSPDVINRIEKFWPATFICFLLAAVTFGAFWPLVHHDFINCDDQLYVTENGIIQSGLHWDGLVWAFSTAKGGNWHPLTWLSHMLDVQLFGLKPGWHHLTSLILHLANTVLVFMVLRRMTGAQWRSAFVAALFALHPLHVESVAWVSERKDVLSTFFFFLTLLAYVRYAEMKVQSPKSKAQSPEPPVHASHITHHASLYYILTLLFLALGLMSKPMLVTMPFVLLLLDYWPLGRVEIKNQKSKIKNLLPLVLEKIPFLALSAAMSVVTFLAQKQSGAVANTVMAPFELRIENALVSYAAYLLKMLWPVRLAILYPYPTGIPAAFVGIALLILVSISLVAWSYRRKWPYIFVGWAWFVGTLVPVIGLVQVGRQSMADRYSYLPLLGIFIILAWGLADLTARCSRRMVPLAAAAALLLGTCAILTRCQVNRWQDSETLFRHTITVTGDNPVAQESLGAALAGQGRIAEAAEHFAQAVKIDPNYAQARTDLGLTQVLAGQLDEGIRQYRAALTIDPHSENAHFNLGRALASQGKLAEAVPEYQAALQLNPGSLETREFLAEALAQVGKADEAAVHFEKVLQSNPNQAAHWRYGLLLAQTGRPNEAIVHLREAVRLQPDAERHQALAQALAAAGHPELAVAEYWEALRLLPDSVPVLNNLAWILATAPDSHLRDAAQAVKLSEQACRLTSFSQPLLVGTLAAAYAEAGRFEEAVKTAEKAKDLALAAGQKELAEKNEQLLQLYRAGKPYHEK